MKYIIFEDHRVVIFSNTENHDKMAAAVGGKPVGAGIVLMFDGQVKAAGESFTLGIKSRPEDTAIIQRQMDSF